MRTTHTLLLLSTALMLGACQKPEPATPATEATTATPEAAPAPAETAASTPTVAASATATLKPTQGNQTAGEVTFTVVDGGIEISGTISGLKLGSQHGFHVHEKGDCSAADASSAGGHFNPASSQHGQVGHGAHHAGDSNNIAADDQGVATVATRLEGATIGDGASTDVVGKGVIVHADPDDYVTQPTGNAGARLACGVIALSQ
ncbi:Cu-Zn family superoxide dismutase [Luteimonas cucumeris]|uniref:Superoxide dismutase [Cu-Zn] n=1 Tax=Luteimonas cucumeris TaxID=985012 RepID=A0A562LE88_9GAMM|nr:superoxide dismutase family protein [Luteimonas cucumeris]TWI05764.1 Cu-Zn family superoxide dismutase [Luteimonas cucumeris]